MGPSESGTARLRAAIQRVERAVSRLERAIAANDRLAGPDPGELVLALEAAQKENAELHRATETVSSRLDSAIGRLRAVLGA